jgi:hypothetical protein
MNIYGRVIEAGGTLAQFAYSIVTVGSDWDKPPSEHVALRSVDPRYQEEVDERTTELAKAQEMTLEQASAGLAARRARWAAHLERERPAQRVDKEARARPFLAMKKQVEDWVAPPALQRLKKSMLDELAENMRFHDMLGERGDDGDWPIFKMTTEEWLADEIKNAERDLDNSKRRLADEVDNVRQHNEFCAALVAAFPIPDQVMP